MYFFDLFSLIGSSYFFYYEFCLQSFLWMYTLTFFLFFWFIYLVYLVYSFILFIFFITLFKMSLFRLLTDGEPKWSPPKNLSHISCNYETPHSCTLPKEDLKDIWIKWHTPWVLLTSAFILLGIRKTCYINKCRYILHFDAWFLIILTFFWVLWDFFNTHGYIFYDVSKNGYSKLSSNKDNLKLSLWRHNYFHDVTNKILSRESNYIVMWSCDQSLVILVFLWKKLT